MHHSPCRQKSGINQANIQGFLSLYFACVWFNNWFIGTECGVKHFDWRLLFSVEVHIELVVYFGRAWDR
jgi:hypothetical protein